MQQSETINELTLTRRAKEIGRRGHDRFAWTACVDCGQWRWTIVRKRGRICTRCRSCATQQFNFLRRHTDSPMWKGGKRFIGGYIALYLPRGHRFEQMCMSGTRYVLEHRIVMADHLGRCLRADELVHHKDGVRSNNAIGNLELTERGRHSTEHSKGYSAGFAQGYADGLRLAREEVA
jgi:HNH endonuclease